MKPSPHFVEEHPMIRSLLCLALAVFASSTPLSARAAAVAEVSSPNGRLKLEFDVDGDGRLAYRVARDGKPLINDSRLGFILRNGRQLLRGLALDAQVSRSHDGAWEQPWGERRWVRERYNELRASFVERDRDRRRFDVVVRIFDDGLGFRYAFPEQPALGEVQIQEELTEFAIARPATAWWIPAYEWNREEYLYHRTPLAEVGTAQTPITLRTDDGTHLSLHEAALIDYAGMNLMKGDGGQLRASLTPGSPAKVVRRTPFATPWRTIQIGDRAGDLVESSLILNLNEPNKLGDVSWFKPSKYVGVWWSLHLEKESWGTGPKHGATTANTKRYIDFAAKHGFRGVLVEGWNIGWDGDWFANGWNFDFRKPTADYDLDGLAAYAKSKGVHLIGHHETACAVSHYERQMDEAFARFAKLGIDAVKTGYVCDAGQIERQDIADGPVLREWHEGQFMSNHHLRVVQAAAKHRIAINPHEPIKDTGLRRTYPNWITREGARGMEFNAWGHPPNPPAHEPTLVFTRLLAGPMDFTPGVLSLQGRGQPLQSTLARQLALYVVIYSPIQMAADLPEHYAEQPDAFRFIKDVPADWAETKVLNGEIGDFVSVARKDRNSEDWYLGSLTNEHGRVLDVPLSFLDAGRQYTAEIYRDGADAHYLGDRRFAFLRETRTVTCADMLRLRLAPGGGQAVRFAAKAH
ncbi:MAG: glycoside hydrolase family 97 protein [Lysobacteraceae bacterium]|nr:MAG: glycoside hydrolase family 97 protein [Xanthomonadaceae bacterium]